MAIMRVHVHTRLHTTATLRTNKLRRARSSRTACWRGE